MNVNRGSSIGVVVIGRNEGDRLKCCLDSVRVAAPDVVVYVDSGSSDGSPDAARERGSLVVALDVSQPFTAARARNEGFHALIQHLPAISTVQFVDGDCTLHTEWLQIAKTYLESNAETAVVCGRLSERRPEMSVYNRLCAMEWNGLPGGVQSCGGIFMIRTSAFCDVGGFNETLIAGEEPELCQRLRDLRWKIHRLDAPMATHDAAMTRFRQWWKRAMRAGYALMAGAKLHKDSPEPPWKKEIRSNWVWGVGLPLLVIASAWPSSGFSVLLLGLFPMWIWRIARGRRHTLGDSMGDAWLYAFFCMLGKLPSALGQLLFYWRLLTRQKPQLIEYKSDAKAI